MSPNGNPTGEAAYGRFALANQVGPRFSSDWKSGNHRARRLVSEFIGTFGLTFLLLLPALQCSGPLPARSWTARAGPE